MSSINVSIGCVPHTMTIADGGVVFSAKSGFYGVSGRSMFEYRADLWYLLHAESTWGDVAACHIVGMHKLLCEKIAPEHSGDHIDLRFKDDDE